VYQDTTDKNKIWVRPFPMFMEEIDVGGHRQPRFALIGSEASPAAPSVGVGVMIFKDGKILLGKRKASHGDGEYAFPGGHLDYMESYEGCARRETKEETGIEIKNVRFQLLSNMKEYAPKHYVHIGMIADWSSGEPQVLEPEKSESWSWYSLDQLPRPIFVTTELAVRAKQGGQIFFDA